MKQRSLVLVSGVLLAAGVIGAMAAPPRGGMWENGGDGARGNRGGMRGGLAPRSITADEYDTLTRERFARLDKNGDGVIDAAEIEAAIAAGGGRHRGATAKSGVGERVLQRFGDKDGKITRVAFLAEAKRRFAQLDLNNDGKITDDDLPPMMRGRGMLKATGPTIAGPMGHRLVALRQADVKQDGIITQDAFLAVQAQRFDQWDRNKDGVVDASDFQMMQKDAVAYGAKRFLHAYGADADGKVTKDQFFKVAKERFARLDRKGEGRITIGGARADGDRGHRGFGGADGGRGDREQRPDVMATPPAKN